MTDDRTADDREEPPLVFGLIGRVIQRIESGVPAIFRSVNERVLVWCWGLGTLGIFALALVASVINSPSITGVLQGLFVGAFTGLLFAVGFGCLMLGSRKAARPRSGPAVSARAMELNAHLASALRDLNALRVDIIKQVKARSMTRVPIGIAAAIAFWTYRQQERDAPGVLELMFFIVLGAAAGEYWAVSKLDRQYRRRYKDSVLPKIASQLGDLTYRQAAKDEVERLADHGIVPDFDRLEADDEIAGTYDGLPIRIIEVRLRRRQQKKTVVVFNGLFVAITLPRSLTGTTVVLTDRGAWENFKAKWRGGALEVVRLDHQDFEQRYEVCSTDQIEARALLTPAFMERFVELTNRTGSFVPGAIAEGNTMIVALPKRFGAEDLFEPPVYWKAAGGAELVRLENDIRAVLRMADTVINLDFWAAGRQRDAARQRTDAIEA
jgi:hypothetical protein